MTKKQGYAVIFLLFTLNFFVFIQGYRGFTDSVVYGYKIRKLTERVDQLERELEEQLRGQIHKQIDSP